MDFVYLLRVLLKRKWIILGSAFLAAVLAFYLTKNEKKYFRSSTQIATGFAVAPIVEMTEKGVDLYQADIKFQNAITEFTSEPVVSLLGYQLMVHDLENKDPFRQLTEEQKNSDAYKNVKPEEALREFKNRLNSMTTLNAFKDSERKLLEFLALYGYDYASLNENLNLFRRDRTDYLQIDFKSENPLLSAFVVNQLFDEYQRFTNSRRSQDVNQSIDTLMAVMNRKKQEMDVKASVVTSMGGSTAGFGETALLTSGDLKARMLNENSEKMQRESELRRVNAKISALQRAGSNEPQNINTLELEQAQADAAQARRDMNDDPSNKDKQDRYKRLNDNYVALLKKSRNAGGVTALPGESMDKLLDDKARLETLIIGHNASISAYKSQIGQLEAAATSAGRDVGKLETATKELDQASKEYTAAKSRFENAQLSKSSVNNFKQMVEGKPALNPEPSKRMIIVAMAGAAALATSILIIVLLTYMDSSVKTPVIFQRTVGLKLISLVNFMDMKNKRLEDIVANRSQTETVSDRNKFNAFRESIRKLRFEIEKTGKKVFLFTSTKKGQGKTTLIQALAYSMSLSKKKILIIDTNFCNPDLTVQLNAEPVLEKILPYKTAGASLVDQVKMLSKDIGVGTVYAIGSEGGDYTPSEILPRENILHHLKELTAEFDYIFLEGPPLNDFSDSKELTEYVDGVIGVFSAIHIIKQIDKQSIQFFKELNGKFCGSILNMVDLKNVNVS